MKINVAIVEDDPEVLAGLKHMLSFSEDLEITAAFSCAEDFEAAFDSLTVDVILMDIGLPGKDGIECVKNLGRGKSNVQFLMCTNFEDDKKVFDALQAGANGYVLKNAEIQELIQAVVEIYRGGSPMSRKIARRVIQSFHQIPVKQNEFNLSRRESEILNLLAKGFRYKEIATQLFISTETVRTHIRNIYSKLQVQSRTDAINKFYKH